MSEVKYLLRKEKITLLGLHIDLDSIYIKLLEAIREGNYLLSIYYVLNKYVCLYVLV